MKYLITSNQALMEKTFNIFAQSYRTFLNEKTESMFKEVLRESLCASIIQDEEGKVASFCFHREIFCKDWRNPPLYLHDTPDTFLRHIQGRLHILTIEWLTVDPQLLGKFTKVQPADLILGSALTFMKNSIFNASMGYSRQDLKVDLMTTRFGTQIFGTVDRFKIPCSIVLVEDYQLKTHPISRVQDKINELWLSRFSDAPDLERKKAA